MYDGYDADTLELVWQCLFKRYNQVLKALGADDFSAEHTGARKWQREGILDHLVPVDRRF